MGGRIQPQSDLAQTGISPAELIFWRRETKTGRL